MEERYPPGAWSGVSASEQVASPCSPCLVRRYVTPSLRPFNIFFSLSLCFPSSRSHDSRRDLMAAAFVGDRPCGKLRLAACCRGSMVRHDVRPDVVHVEPVVVSAPVARSVHAPV